MATFKTLIDGKWVKREDVVLPPKPAPRIVTMQVRDVRIGDYLADKKAKVARRITNIEAYADLGEGVTLFSFAKGEALSVTTKSVHVLIH